MSVSTALRAQRELAGLGVEEVSRACGISDDVYRALEAPNQDLEYWGAILSNLLIELGLEPWTSADHAQQTVGQHVWRTRVDRGLTQSVVADRIGMSEGHYSTIEEGKSPLETFVPILIRFSKFVGVPIQYLITPRESD